MKLYLFISAFLLIGCAESKTYSQERDAVLPITTARSFVGYSETSNRSMLREYLGIDPVRTEWCAAFVNAVLHENDIPGSESVSEYPLTARSFLQYGERVSKSDIDIGDIVIFPRGSQGWQGHVGFYAGTMDWLGEDYYIILGGNQGDSVNYSLYKASSAIGIQRIPSRYIAR